MRVRRGPIPGALRLGFALAGIAFMGLAFGHGWAAAGQAPLPAWPGLLGAFAAVSLGLLAAGRGWVALFEGSRSSPGLLHAFYQSQLGKYIPGGIWQPLGQVTLAAGSQISLARAATLLPVHVVTQLAAGAVVGSGIGIVGFGLPGWLRAISLCGLGALLLLDRRWMAAAARYVSAWRKQPDHHAALPSQAAILRSFAWSCATLVGSGAGLALLLVALGVEGGGALAVPAFAFAWMVGFLAFPFPSGVGVREATLLLLLSSGGALVVAASVIHRLVTITAEGVLILASRRILS